MNKLYIVSLEKKKNHTTINHTLVHAHVHICARPLQYNLGVHACVYYSYCLKVLHITAEFNIHIWHTSAKYTAQIKSSFGIFLLLMVNHYSNL